VLLSVIAFQFPGSIGHRRHEAQLPVNDKVTDATSSLGRAALALRELHVRIAAGDAPVRRPGHPLSSTQQCRRDRDIADPSQVSDQKIL
jgi:hypothetical protein